MSNQIDYSEEEWYLLKTLPSLIGSAVAMAGRSGMMGTIKEMMATAHAVQEGTEMYNYNELINGLVETVGDRKEAQAKAKEMMERAQSDMQTRGIKEPADLAQAAVEDIERAMALLAEKTTLDEANEYAQFAYNVGLKVAEAAKEGGFLGFGGERVSDEEEVVLAQISAAFGF